MINFLQNLAELLSNPYIATLLFLKILKTMGR